MLQERIEKDLIGALKKKDELVVSTLRLLKSDMQNYMIEKKLKELKDEDVISIIQKQAKKHREAIEQFKKGKRDDLATKEESELKVLKSYMPEELTEEELKKTIKDVIGELGAQGKKDFGKVMKEVMAKTRGRADGKAVSGLVNELLGG